MNPTRYALRISLRNNGGATRALVARTATVGRRTFADKPPDPSQANVNARFGTDPPPPSGPNGSGPTFGSHYNPAFSSMDSNEPPRPNIQHDPTVITEKSSKLGALITVVLLAGVAVTVYGIGELYGSLTIWPKELRGDLRQGLKEALKGDKSMAERYLYRAWQTSKSLPISKFGTKEYESPYLKTTGVAIALAGLYEEQGKLKEAYEVYKDALGHMQMHKTGLGIGGVSVQQEGPVVGVDSEPAPGTVEKQGNVAPASSTGSPITDSETSAQLIPNLNPRERMRAVAISYKLAELSQKLHLSKDEEEKWLAWSVETVLRDVMRSPAPAEVIIKVKDAETGKEVEEARGIVEQLKLPNWALKHDLAAPFEALGTFYSKQGKLGYAMPLYLQAIAILVPPPPQISSADDRCRAAQMMGNISELILRSSFAAANSPSSETLTQAESWAQKCLDVAGKARKATFVTHPVCEEAYAFGLFNLGMISEMSGDQNKARQLFADSLDQSRSIGFLEGMKNAEAAIEHIAQHTGIGSGATV